MSIDQVTDISINPTYVDLIDSVISASFARAERKSRISVDGNVVIVDWRWVSFAMGKVTPVGSVDGATHIQILNVYCERHVSGSVAIDSVRITYPRLVNLPQ